MKRKISIVTGCYNEEENVEALFQKTKELFSKLQKYDFEHIFIDNSSSDNTVKILKKIANTEKKLKIIVNARNFGHIRSPYYGMLQADGDAVILMAADFQDPPDLIPEFIQKWESGSKIVVGIKKASKENPIMFLIRKLYYVILKKISTTEQIKNFTGFGLYDKQFMEVLRQLDDPYPYFRGLISDLGFNVTSINFTQPKREKGKSNNNFFTLYDMAMLGFVNHSKVPLRLAVFIGLLISALSLGVAIFYLIYKLIYWESFRVGMAPLVIGMFFLGSIQLIFLGIIGEYIGAIFTQVRHRPLVIEKERVNFE